MNMIPRRRWTDSVGLDVRGVLAILVIIGLFALALLDAIHGGSGEVPPWCIALASLITGHYFGAKAGTEATIREKGAHADERRDR